MDQHRRNFIKKVALGTAGFGLASTLPYSTWASTSKPGLFFDISLAEFSFASSLYTGAMNHLDFPAKAKNDFGISIVEYVSGFWKEKPTNMDYLKELKKRADDAGVRSGLIMVDGAGNLGDSNETKRKESIDNHLQWLEAAKFLGCHSIRVNLDGDGTDEDVAKACVDGYGRLVELGEKNKIAILAENHIGPSVNPDWMINVFRQVKSKYSGALVDTSNFVRYHVEEMTLEAFKNAKITATYDKYDGVKKLMPYAKGVSAKTHRFDAQGNDMETDFAKMLKIVKDAGFRGTIGIEYEGAFMKNIMQMEGDYPSEDEGIRATQNILKKEGEKLS